MGLLILRNSNYSDVRRLITLIRLYKHLNLVAGRHLHATCKVQQFCGKCIDLGFTANDLHCKYCFLNMLWDKCNIAWQAMHKTTSNKQTNKKQMPIRMHSSSAPTAVSFSPAPPSSRIFTRPSVHLIHTSFHNTPGQSGQRKWREENLSLVTLQADYGAEQVSQALPRGHRTRPPRSHQRLSHVKVARGVRWGPRGSCPRPLQRCAHWARKTLDPVLPFEWGALSLEGSSALLHLHNRSKWRKVCHLASG